MSIYEPIKIFDSNNTFLLDLDRTSYLVNRVKNHSVLHVGCSDYPITQERLENNNLLHVHLMKTTAYLLGIDSSIEGVNILKEKGINNIILMDAENIILDEKFDFIIAGDVVEHMNNPGRFLEKVGDLLNRGGRLIVGVPNAYSFNILKYVISGYEPTHKDHTYFFSVKTLSELCSRYGLLPVRLVFTAQPVSTGNRYVSKIRDFLIGLQSKLAPSFIMEFMQIEHVDRTKYYEWK